MHKFRLAHILTVVLAALFFSQTAHAQFKTEAFQNGFGADETAAPSDSAKSLFSFKEYFAGLSHKQDMRIGTMCAGSAIFVGGNQIYNRQYWKLPVIYTALGATAAGGFIYKDKNSTASTLFFAGTALTYWGAMFDGVYSYKTTEKHSAGKATMYSLLCPGLGQAYNGEYWKIPIYVGALSTSIAFYHTNKTGYERFRRIYNEASNPDSSYDGTITAETALYYRNIYRRYRDYSVLAIAASYLLQVIDANVFSYMQDFEVNDDLTLDIKPSVILPDTQFAFNGGGTAGVGLRIGLSF